MLEHLLVSRVTRTQEHFRARGQKHTLAPINPENCLVRLRLDSAFCFCASLRKTFQFGDSGDSERVQDTKMGVLLAAVWDVALYHTGDPSLERNPPSISHSSECRLESFFLFKLLCNIYQPSIHYRLITIKKDPCEPHRQVMEIRLWPEALMFIIPLILHYPLQLQTWAQIGDLICPRTQSQRSLEQESACRQLASQSRPSPSILVGWLSLCCSISTHIPPQGISEGKPCLTAEAKTCSLGRYVHFSQACLLFVCCLFSVPASQV